MTSIADLARASANAGDLSIGTTLGAIGVGFLLALVIAAYLFYKLFAVFFKTDLLKVLGA